MEVHPKHANTLYNFAVMLDTHLKRRDEAEVLYRNALEVEPRHAYALYNLAVLLEERSFNSKSDIGNAAKGPLASIGKEESLRKEICTLYKRAVDADPRDAVTLADYGR